MLSGAPGPAWGQLAQEGEAQAGAEPQECGSAMGRADHGERGNGPPPSKQKVTLGLLAAGISVAGVSALCSERSFHGRRIPCGRRMPPGTNASGRQRPPPLRYVSPPHLPCFPPWLRVPVRHFGARASPWLTVPAARRLNHALSRRGQSGGLPFPRCDHDHTPVLCPVLRLSPAHPPDADGVGRCPAMRGRAHCRPPAALQVIGTLELLPAQYRPTEQAQGGRSHERAGSASPLPRSVAE